MCVKSLGQRLAYIKYPFYCYYLCGLSISLSLDVLLPLTPPDPDFVFHQWSHPAS